MRAQIRAYDALVARAAHENWDLSDLEQHLAAAGDVPAENIEACARFWRNERLKVRTGCGTRVFARARTRLRIWFTDRRTISRSRAQIHAVVHKRGVWNNHFDSLRWRVDVTARSRDHDELNEPTAIFELRTTPGAGRGAPRAATTKRGEATEPDVVRFEMSRDEVSSVVDQLHALQAEVNTLAGGAGR